MDNRTAKAGDVATPKAAARWRRITHLRELFQNQEDMSVKPKTDAKEGQWACIDCGEFLANNMQAHGHPKSHRLAWWTSCRFEEP